MNRFMRFIGQVVIGTVLLGISGVTAQAAWEGSANSGILSGKIASIDTQQNLLKIKTGLFARYNFVVKETSRISDGNREMRLEDLKPGDEVSISFDSKDGKRVVSSMRVNSSTSHTEVNQSAGAQDGKAQVPAAEPVTPPSEAQPYKAETPAQTNDLKPAGEIQ